jgi:hypothetical protein
MTFHCSHHRFARAALPGLALSLGLAACVVPVDEEVVEATGETEQSLLVSNWSAPQQIGTARCGSRRSPHSPARRTWCTPARGT